MLNQNEEVKKYFDELSKVYGQRAAGKNPYHLYFFRERLQLATENFDFHQKNILDIGAGLGGLYDFLNEKYPNTSFEYCATDISRKMLEQSQIPNYQQFVGSISEIELPRKQFDLIFLLGLTTYFTKKDWDQHLIFLEEYLAPNGKAIISFTNRNSLDFRFRKIISPFFRLFKKKKILLSQNFQIFALSPTQFVKTLPPAFKAFPPKFFNFIISPFNQIIPNLYIPFANRLKKQNLSPTLQSYLGADFLVIIEKDDH